MCQTCTLAHHLSLGCSMFRTSHQSSESCGFDPNLGVRNRFLRIEFDEHSSISQDISDSHISEIYIVYCIWFIHIKMLSLKLKILEGPAPKL